ncbi:MAG: hypothetical protein U1F43_20695 [Myxococcota bacterium]
MRRSPLSLLSLAFAATPLVGCPQEDFLVVPAPSDVSSTGSFFDTANPSTLPPTGTFTSDFDTSGSFDTSGGFDVSGSGGYYDDIRPRLTGCTGCHAADGPVAPPLHSYVALRNASDDVLRALRRGHDGNFTRLAASCEVAADAGLAELIAVVERWRDAGFPNGTLGPQDPPGNPPPAPTTTLTTASVAGVSDVRCYLLGAIPGDLGRARVAAEGIAWVELYALSPALADARASLDALDVAPGWSCGADLGLVPQPLVGFWEVGDKPMTWPGAPLRSAPGALLVARVGRFAPSPSVADVEPTLAVDLWTEAVTGDATVSVPLHTGAASTGIPWSVSPVRVAAVESSPEVEQIQRFRPLEPDRCLQDRFCTTAECDPPPTWPGVSIAPADTGLNPADRLQLTCSAGGPCDAQLMLAGAFEPESCDAAAKACAATCSGDLGCIHRCALDQDDRCALCVVTSQLACREHACPTAATTAWNRLESCAAATDPEACVHDSVFEPFASCAAAPLCAPALAACGL